MVCLDTRGRCIGRPNSEIQTNVNRLKYLKRVTNHNTQLLFRQGSLHDLLHSTHQSLCFTIGSGPVWCDFSVSQTKVHGKCSKGSAVKWRPIV